MKKQRVAFLIVIIFLLLIIVFLLQNNYQYRTLKVEIFESDEQYLIIKYYKPSAIRFKICEKEEKFGGITCSASFVSDNTAVLDGSEVFPQIPDIYYEFVFLNDSVELYNHGELLDKFDLIINY